MSRKFPSPVDLQEPGDQPRLGNTLYIAGVSPDMQTVQRLTAEIAPTDIPVLLVGESGTGKEVVALHIHELSEYCDLPFVQLSGATAESLQAQIGHLTHESRESHQQLGGNPSFY